jgi:hypothetical protein
MCSVQRRRQHAVDGPSCKLVRSLRDGLRISVFAFADCCSYCFLNDCCEDLCFFPTLQCRLCFSNFIMLPVVFRLRILRCGRARPTGPFRSRSWCFVVTFRSILSWLFSRRSMPGFPFLFFAVAFLFSVRVVLFVRVIYYYFVLFLFCRLYAAWVSRIVLSVHNRTLLFLLS